ncbi:heme utilization protein HutZ [Psychromonas ossibalaenae]|uniref:heme utilization protein HutZ n=1 Tax=Psychromonas ossibalaenae TaxID=444922 RepID=UPI0003709719|nr:heme utilization protein HutZ [Psychromonas ossibalaenae]
MNAEIKKERLQNRLGPEIKEFRESKKTLQLATVCKDGKPNVSYAPFIALEDGYYVLISEIARHTRNLQENPQASLMLIEDEENAKTIFARTRLTFDVDAQMIDRESAKWNQAIPIMKESLGEIIDSLSGLEDFKLIQLKPKNGLFVKGFGKAYQVSDNDLVDFVHLDKGHTKVDKKTA